MTTTKFHRRSLRLKGYDYSEAGAYFVTICTKERECLFGEIMNGKIQMNRYGCVTAQCWQWLSTQYPHVNLDEWIVMPNHLHGILVIADIDCRGGSRTAPTGVFIRKPLGRLIGAFKTVSTKQINEIRGKPGVPIWQRNYYERVIRHEKELFQIRQYIQENPLKWDLDPENPYV